MKKALLTIVAALLLVCHASAQNEGRRDRMNMADRTEFINRQATRLVKDMKLGDDKKDLFIALYMDYQSARFNVINPTGGDQESTDNRVDLKGLSDEKAAQLIENNFTRQEKQLAVDREYYKKFAEFLTPAQMAYIFLQRRSGWQQGQGRPEGGQGYGPRGGGYGGPRGGGFGGPGGGF